MPYYLLVLLVVLASPVVCEGGEVSKISSINFGLIDLHPGGDSIEINGNSPNTDPISDRSIVTGGHCGQIVVTAGEEADIEITYPSTVQLINENRTDVLTISKISENSQYGSGDIIHLDKGSSVSVNVGGVLTIPRNVRLTNFSGRLKIQVDIRYL